MVDLDNIEFFRSNNAWMDSNNITNTRQVYVVMVQGAYPNMVSMPG